MEPINVLSLFDGMSCGQIALERAGIPVRYYYASEIDKYAIQIARKNYPDTVHLGDVNNWRGWNLPWIDLVIAGSPCQGLSVAGRRLGLEDPRSKLFYVFLDILKALKARNPDIKFLLENVKMKKESRDIMTEELGVEPVLINSALVSAQNRERYYWCNWSVTQPADKGIILKDIVEYGEVDRLKSYCLDANYHKGGSSNYLKNIQKKSKRQAVKYQSSRRLMVHHLGHGYKKEKTEVEPDKHPTLAAQSPHTKHMLVFVGGIGDKDWAKDGKGLSRNYPQGRRIYSDEGKAASLSSTGVGSFGGATGIYRIGTAKDVEGHDYNKRVYSTAGKSPTLNAHSGGNLEPKIAIDEEEYIYRKLTPLECERLQTVPEGYTEGVSNTQRYKMLGNGWTVDVVAHILSRLEFSPDS